MPNTTLHQQRAAATNWSWGRELVHARFSWLLLALLAFILVEPWIAAGREGRWERIVMFVCVMLATVFAARRGRSHLVIAIIFALVCSGIVASYLAIPSPALALIGLSLGFVWMLFTILSILEFVLGSGKIGFDHILGAICAYVLIAMAAASIYVLIDMAVPASFTGLQNQTDSSPWPQFLYFSFTTLSTVGYGDILPVTPLARSIAMVEQLTGTFYVAILIGRLAGLYPPPQPEENDSQSDRT